ncbi:MAG: glycosyltransferase family 2 protein, partial [Gammaproteobacteria bacterium]
MNSLSVIIITKNESTDIRACLDSVRWADEIVVVDGGSRDDTVAICREYTDKVYICEDWSGFGPQKNRALSYATGEWVLSVDADERVTPALRKEIEHAMVSERFVGYEIPRRSSYCGRALRHGGW